LKVPCKKSRFLAYIVKRFLYEKGYPFWIALFVSQNYIRQIYRIGGYQKALHIDV